MTVTASETVDVTSSPQACLELVLDLEAYRKIDPKIRRILSAPELDDQGRGRARYITSMWHFPPAPDTHDVHLDAWRSLTLTGVPRVPARLIFDFTGRFQTEPIPGGTRLTHSYEMSFKGPFRWLEPRLQRWLDADMREEAARLAARLGPLLSA